jgi:16S rRNA (guanine966-N2)-methyltransferase
MIRIAGGAWRGRRLAVPQGLATRPTSDRARKTLFDVLLHARFAGRAAIEGARVLDAFAGSGALALEALSHGAAEAVCLETDAAALVVLAANIAACKTNARIMRADATKPPQAPWAASLVFLDPPYGEGLPDRALIALTARGWIAPGALVCVETARADPLLADPLLAENFTLQDDRAQGRARLRILSAPSGPSSPA